MPTVQDFFLTKQLRNLGALFRLTAYDPVVWQQVGVGRWSHPHRLPPARPLARSLVGGSVWCVCLCVCLVCSFVCLCLQIEVPQLLALLQESEQVPAAQLAPNSQLAQGIRQSAQRSQSRGTAPHVNRGRPVVFAAVPCLAVQDIVEERTKSRELTHPVASAYVRSAHACAHRD